MEDTKKRRMMPLLLLLTVVFSFNAWSSASISAAKTMDTKAETKGSEKKSDERQSAPALDVVDTQIHIGPGGIEETLAAMDAMGIQSVLIDEFWLPGTDYKPHHDLSEGAIRPINPTAELAAQLYPERFSWVLRVDRMDPEYAAIIRMVRDAPSGRGIRIIPGMTLKDTQAFADGEYDHILAATEKAGLPLFLYLPDHPELIADAAKKFPNLRIIVDHIGLYSNAMRTMFGGAVPARSPEEQQALFDKVLALSTFPNIALKWSHASEMFDTPVYPGEDLQPLLRKAISSFGADRIMWASDFSVNQRGENWSEILYGVKGNFKLSDQERAAILGGTARKWLNWPVQ
ncbi:amidohydrolase family protein [Paenibacillus macerans]|nr:amidohydrolase family protein [Paenibacillus macerans]MEC0137792.1 amidohydrolase family protein [Paenibacillus macerans]GBK60241.1 amidohydrolase [Paenibacillus macerans]GBK66538.1 amidohydrolase [Paenibacillus macerans]